MFDLLFDVIDKATREHFHVPEILEKRNNHLIRQLTEVFCKAFLFHPFVPFLKLTQGIRIDVPNSELIEKPFICLLG